ncbi:hypothetical protein ACA910_011159 [Epithemia clementina (nom. ined.)]
MTNTEAKQRRTTSSMSGDTTPTAAATTLVPTVYKPTKSPKEALYTLYKVSHYKAGLPMNLLIVQSVMAGIYIAMAGQLYLSVGAGILGAAVFPVGLIAVVLTSAELFTGDTLVFTTAVLGGQVGVDKLIRNWAVSWVFNFFGCIVWASIITYASDALDDSGNVELAIAIAEKKALQPWIHIFLKAIGANFMVCLGVWQSTCAEDVAGKIMAIWFPIAGFVMMGLEHIIANQYLIPVGMMYAGSAGKISVLRLLCALSAATLGNIIGGALLMGAVYWYINDSMSTHNNSGNGNGNGNGSTHGNGNGNAQPLMERLRQAMLAFASASEAPPGSTPTTSSSLNKKTEEDDETKPIMAASGGGENGENHSSPTNGNKPAVSTVDRIV